MPYVPVTIRIHKKMYRDMMQLMRTVIKDGDDITRYRCFEGTSKQDWYRILIQRGIDATQTKFSEKKKLIENEGKDSN